LRRRQHTVGGEEDNQFGKWAAGAWRESRNDYGSGTTEALQGLTEGVAPVL